MAFSKIWAVEQSILGKGSTALSSVSQPELFEWARLKPPDDVEPFVWRTELAMVYFDKGSSPPYKNAFIQSLVAEFGYLPTVFARTESIEAGRAACRLYKTKGRRNVVRTYKISSQDSGIVWSWDPIHRYTKGLVYGIDTDGYNGVLVKIAYLQFSLQRYSHLRANPLLLGLLMLHAETYAFDDELQGWSEDLKNAQVKTGRHNYINRERRFSAVKDVDLTELSADICGTATTISQYTLALQGLQRSLQFLLEECHSLQDHDFDKLTNKAFLHNFAASKPSIASAVRTLQFEANQYLEEARRLQWNSQILLETIFTLASQKDQTYSIELARDTKVLAQQATKDGNSMKAIAAVTMCFLPGTFVASFFAMPMFSFQVDPGNIVSKSFWLYWVVTLPITFTVIGVWLAWANRESLKQCVTDRKRGRARQRDSENALEPFTQRDYPNAFAPTPKEDVDSIVDLPRPRRSQSLDRKYVGRWTSNYLK